MTEFLDPRNDIAFKKIFGEARNKDILLHFLNDVLHKDGVEVIIDVVIINPIQLPEIVDKKESIVDVLCTDGSGMQYIVEMQVSGHKGFVKRAQYYAAKAYSRQANKSGVYHDLKGVIFLAILDFVMFPGKKEYISTHWILDKKSYERDLKDFHFTFIELPKFTKTDPKELSTYEEKWCYFFKHGGEPDNMRNFLSSITDESKILQKAYDVLEAHNWSETELLQYDRMELMNMDMRAREEYIIDEAEARGEARGEIRGIEIGKIKVAQLMKKQGFSNEQTALYTQLPLTQIEQLFD